MALVAVSKIKPVSDLMDAYAAGQRLFGENYVQEILDKAPRMPADVRWHFIGHLQSNKAKGLVEGVPNLHCLETIDTEKLAGMVSKAVGAAKGKEPERAGALDVMVQVNTSGEDSKSGVTPEQCGALAAFVHSDKVGGGREGAREGWAGGRAGGRVPQPVSRHSAPTIDDTVPPTARRRPPPPAATASSAPTCGWQA